MKYSMYVALLVLTLMIVCGYCDEWQSLVPEKGAPKFCDNKQYNDILFISQPRVGQYFIFDKNDHFSKGTFNGTSFNNPPDGPFSLTKSFVGLHSVKEFLNKSNENSFTSLLFVQPKDSDSILQFLGDKLYYWTGKNKITSVEWPSNCPKTLSFIINRSLQPHVLVDKRRRGYNLTVDINTGKSSCSESYKLFLEDAVAAMGVDAPLSGHPKNKDPHSWRALKVYRWLRDGKICFLFMPSPENLATSCTDITQLPNNWQLFACPDPNLKIAKSHTVFIVIGSVVGLIILGIIIYCLTTRIYSMKKNELDKSDILNSQIQ